MGGTGTYGTMTAPGCPNQPEWGGLRWWGASGGESHSSVAAFFLAFFLRLRSRTLSTLDAAPGGARLAGAPSEAAPSESSFFSSSSSALEGSDLLTPAGLPTDKP